jgi:hypothetical protein
MIQRTVEVILMKTKLLATSLAVGLALTTAAVSAPVAAASAPAERGTVLTNTDNGRTVTVHTGDVITVKLQGSGSPGGDVWAWSEPTAADGTILARTKASVTPDGDATAVFSAERNGSTEIDASKKCVPKPGHLCPYVIILWKATVNVT